jgi:hypothetical protein
MNLPFENSENISKPHNRNHTYEDNDCSSLLFIHSLNTETSTVFKSVLDAHSSRVKFGEDAKVQNCAN